MFSEAPDAAEVLPIIGNPHLRPPHAQHYSLGVEQEVGERLKLTVEGFYKRLGLLTVNSPVPGENLNNDGIGRIYGGEASAKLRPTTQSSGFLSYTLSRSERNDHGTGWRLFNWDQTHIIGTTAEGSDRELYTAMLGDPPVPTPVRESLQISHFTTAGKLKSQFSFVESADGNAETAVAVKWNAPGSAEKSVEKSADVPAAGLPVTMTFVVRDDRGGTDWTTRALCVSP